MLHLDYETRSRTDLRTIGLAKYARDPSTEALLASFRLGDTRWRWRKGDAPDERFINAVRDGATVAAWNAPFEMAMTNHCLTDWGVQLSPENVFDIMAYARYYCLPGSLDKASERMLSRDKGKSKDGRKLMLKMCKPQRDGSWLEDDDSMEALHAYCDQDVEADVNMLDAVEKAGWGPWPDSEQKLWVVDQQINLTGIPVDLDMCRGATKIMEEVQSQILEDLPFITNGEVHTPNQIAAIKTWLAKNEVVVDDLRKETIDTLLATQLPRHIKRVLQCRQMGAPAAVKKYQSALDREVEGRIFNSIVYYGAGSTGRWSSQGFQTQNMKRGQQPESIIEAIQMGDFSVLDTLVDDPITAMQQAVRQCICAPEGHSLVTADYSAIEARVVQWVAENWDGVEVFKAHDEGRGEEPYKVTGGDIFSCRPSEISGERRTCGKIAVLGSGYGSGAGQFQAMAANYGVELTLPFCETAVAKWRKKNHKVVKFWYALKNGFEAVFRGRDEVQVGRWVKYRNLGGKVIAMDLPSGRSIFYHDVHQATNPRTKRKDMVYRRHDGQLRTVWHGLLMENVCQAIARDCLADSLKEFTRCGFKVIHHAHDEMTMEVRDDEVDSTLEEIKRVMRGTPEWAPGLPLFTKPDYGRRYSK